MASIVKITNDICLNRFREVHGDRYNYSKVIYTKQYNKVCIICPIHGEFWQTPKRHWNGCGCPICGGSEKLTTEQFIEKAKQVHGDKYDYRKVEYKNSSTKVCIICPIHGEFWQTPANHLNGYGCVLCGIERSREAKVFDASQFIKKAKEIHGDKYDYGHVEYKNNATKVEIYCNKCRNLFSQTPNKHLLGRGCPICKNSHLESLVFDFLKKNNVKFEYQKRFEWLGKLSLDFYLPQHNIAIECQGRQHFQIVKAFGGEKTFNATIERDDRKKALCCEHNIKILYFSNLGINFPYNVITDLNDILTFINDK